MISTCNVVTIRDCAFFGPAGPDPEPAPPLPLVAILSIRADDLSPITVTDCAFFVRANRVGLRIDGGSRRSVSGCHFTGTSPKQQNRKPVIGSFTVSSRMERRPADFVEDDARGLFAMTGNPDFVLNLSAVPAAARPAVADWLRRAPALLGLKPARSPEDWAKTESTLSLAAEAIVAKPRTRGQLALAEDAETRRTSATPIGLTPGPDTGIPPVDSIDLPDITRPDLVEIDIGTDTFQIDPDRYDSLIDKLEEIEVQASGWLYQRNFGLWMTGRSVCDTLVADNHFRFVHSAIVLRHDGDDPTPAFSFPPARRPFATTRSCARPSWGRPSPSSAKRA